MDSSTSASDSSSPIMFEGGSLRGTAIRNMAETMWIQPVRSAMKFINRVMLSMPDSSVKNVVAMVDKQSGERPKSAMLAPEAIPGYLGKVLEAAKRDEKYLRTIWAFEL